MDAPKKQNRLYRRWLRSRCEANHRFRERILDRCAHDLIYYTNSFAWQYNPALSGEEVGPFILRPRQEEVLKTTTVRLLPDRPRRLRLDVIWEKSREEGASWMALIMFDWRSLFYRRQKFLCISHTADAVDKPDDPDSLFWKMEFMHQHLPDWITRGAKKRKLGFWFPATKSAITGQASTVRSGVGGRASVVLLDELGKMENAREILSQTASTANRLQISTHYGTGTEFYRQTIRPDIFKEIIHWSQNPEKARGAYRFDPDKNQTVHLDPSYEFEKDYPFVRNPDSPGGPFKGIRSPWYDAEEMRVGSRRDMALHHDIDPESSGWQFFEDALVNRLLRSKHVREPLWEGEFLYSETGIPLGLQPRKGGPLRLWTNPMPGGAMPVGRYGMGCDLGNGTGATPSCLSVGEADLGMKVAEYGRADMDPIAFAPVAAALGRLFRDLSGAEAYFAWEAAGSVGKSFAMNFFPLGYRNVYMRRGEIRRGGMLQEAETPGWYPTPQERMLLLTRYRSALNGTEWINPSKPSLEELRRFEYTSGGQDVKHAGEKSDNPSMGSINHGDMATADALSWLTTTQRGGRRPLADPERDPTPGGWEWRMQRNLESDRLSLVGDD